MSASASRGAPQQSVAPIAPPPSPFERLELDLSSGYVRGHRYGEGRGEGKRRLVLCVHGLSANSCSYDFLGAELAKDGREVVAIDLRGRGWSEISRPGKYGWQAHARDLLEVATKLGHDHFDLVGHSMGAFIGMELARQAGQRLGKLVLVDAVGIPEPASLVPIVAAVQRLQTHHESADTYVAAVRRLGIITPWSDVWERHYRYDLVPAGAFVRPRTNHAAVVEDATYGASQNPRHLWTFVRSPSLLVRASRPLGFGHVVSHVDQLDYVRQVIGAETLDVDANHYGVLTHADTARAVRRFLA